MKRISGTYKGIYFIGVIMFMSLSGIKVLLSKESAQVHGKNILVIDRKDI